MSVDVTNFQSKLNQIIHNTMPLLDYLLTVGSSAGVCAGGTIGITDGLAEGAPLGLFVGSFEVQIHQ